MVEAEGEVKKLPEEVVWSLRRADGYLDLRMWAKAEAELAQVPADYRSATPYREMELRFAVEREQWARAEQLAEALRATDPDQAAHWVQWAYATRRATGIEAARSILREARDHFPGEAVIPFNLACYACQLGDTEAALHYLREAVAMEPTYREMAMQDEDLQPLWEHFES